MAVGAGRVASIGIAGVLGLAGAGQLFAQSGPLVIENQPSRGPPAHTNENVRAALLRAEKQGALSLRARSVSVKGQWMGGLVLPMKACALLTPESVSEAMNAVRKAVTVPDEAARAIGSAARIEVFWVDINFNAPKPAGGSDCDGAPTVEVELRPIHLRVATESVGENVLPLARNALGTAYSQVPGALLALNPGITVDRDSTRGTVMGLSLRTTQLEWAPGFEAHGKLSKSVDGSFHDAAAGLRWQRRHSGRALFETRLHLSGHVARIPLGGALDDLQSVDLGGGIGLRLASHARLWLDTGLQSRRDKVESSSQIAVRRESHLWLNRLLFDSLSGEGLSYSRAALWHERGDTTKWVAAGAIAREFRFSQGHLLGVELGLQFGRTGAGTVDERRFRGGPPASQLLYEGTASPALLALPDGPTLRSVGHTQAQLGTPAAGRGGTRFASASLNVAMPVARWYKPLIPDEVTDLQLDDSQPALTLKQVLMRQVAVTGPSMLAADLTSKGMNANEARSRAEEALAPLKPAVRFLVEDAPLYAARPLFMLDVAQLADSVESVHWVAVGLGAQVQLATARFEAGYMRTVSRPIPSGAHGAVVFRMTFQTLF
jgi:hypothetical protein